MTINKNTGVSIGLLITVLGGVIWLTEIYERGVATAQAVQDQQVDLKSIARDINDIKTDVAVIKRELKEN